jgi:hypothetical protein
MKRLGNYIREETNNISFPFDIYTTKSENITTNEDDDAAAEKGSGENERGK